MPHIKTPHDCMELAEMVGSHERRLTDFEKWKVHVSSDLKGIIDAQKTSSDAVQDFKREIVSKIDPMAASVHAMQLENATLIATIRAEEKHNFQAKADSKWLTSIFMSIPQLLITLAIIFAALKYTPK